ncbi:MAG: hypothetical protein ACI9XK_003924 [Granulosicoccus sp.]|jgi:hypothetical protein
MIVKKRDAQFEVIQALEEQSATTRDVLKRNACISAASRLRADSTTQRATELVDFYFAQREDWAVIHDLRMRVGSHAIQINHVLVHNSVQIVCLDTRYLNCQIERAENEQYKVLSTTKKKIITSPLSKMAKDVRLLKSSLESIGWLPKRFGFKLNTPVRGGVLVGIDSAKKDVRLRITDVGMYSSEAFFANLCDSNRFGSGLLRRRLSGDAFRELATLLVRQHSPIYPSHLLESESEKVLAV